MRSDKRHFKWQLNSSLIIKFDFHYIMYVHRVMNYVPKYILEPAQYSFRLVNSGGADKRKFGHLNTKVVHLNSLFFVRFINTCNYHFLFTMISCLRSIHAWKSRNSNDTAIFTAICSIWPRVSCRGHHISFHVGSPLPKRSENTFLTTRIIIWLHFILWRVSPPGRSLLYWFRLLNTDAVGYSWRSTSRRDRVLLNEGNFLSHYFPQSILL